MQLVVIVGPAAAGKLTVARELARRTSLRLFHNHLVVDMVTAVFPFGSEPFVALREQTWLAVFREAAARDVSLIFTFAPERTVTPDFITTVLTTIEAAGGTVLFVELTCPLGVLEQRITDLSRAAFGKLRSVELWRELRAAGSHRCPPMPRVDLTIDTSQTTPAEAAARIIEHFGLAVIAEA